MRSQTSVARAGPGEGKAFSEVDEFGARISPEVRMLVICTPWPMSKTYAVHRPEGIVCIAPLSLRFDRRYTATPGIRVLQMVQILDWQAGRLDMSGDSCDESLRKKNCNYRVKLMITPEIL